MNGPRLYASDTPALQERILTDHVQVDCGSAPMTFFDNTIALKQLDKAHEVSSVSKGSVIKRLTLSDCIQPAHELF